MKNTNCLVLLTFFCLFSAPACKKYEDGPILSLRTKKARLVGDWKISETFANGLKLNGPIQITGLQIKKGGTFSFEYNTGYAGVKNGTWSLTNTKQYVDLSDSCCTERYKILRLKNKELWLQNSLQQSTTSTIELEYHFEQ